MTASIVLSTLRGYFSMRLPFRGPKDGPLHHASGSLRVGAQ